MQPVSFFAAVIDLDVTFFFQLALFLVFLVVMNSVLFKPLLVVLDRRRAETDQRERDAVAGAQEAEELLLGYEREMVQANAQGMAERNRCREEALRVEAERLNAAREAAAAWVEKETEQFSIDIEKAKEAAGPAVQELSTDLVGILSRVD